MRPPRLLQSILSRGPLPIYARNTFRSSRITLMVDEEAGRLAVRRKKHLEAPLELRVVECLRRKVKEIIVSRGVEALPHDDAGVTHGLHLVDHRLEGAVRGQRERPSGLQAGKHRRQQLGHVPGEHVGALDICRQLVELLVYLIDAV